MPASRDTSHDAGISGRLDTRTPGPWRHGTTGYRRPGVLRARPPRLKERTHAVSVYLEPPVFERLRVLAFEERTKMHTLMLEAVDLLLSKRGQRSIKKLTGGR